MKKSLFFFIAVLGLAGCEVSRGGAGQTTSGDPVIAELRLDGATNQQSYVLSSIQGWRCVGTLSKEQAFDTTSSVYQVPLICDDGTVGTSMISVDRFKATANINFRLANGTVGNATVGG